MRRLSLISSLVASSMLHLIPPIPLARPPYGPSPRRLSAKPTKSYRFHSNAQANARRLRQIQKGQLRVSE